MKLLRTLSLPALALAALFPACGSHTQRNPSLTKSPETPQSKPQEKKSFLSRTADATWNVVSAPVRLVTPQKKPPAPPPEPTTYEAPEAIIMIPQAEGGEGLLGVASQPATTPPTTQPK